MRVLFLSDLPPYDGGSGYSGLELQQGLSEEGVKIFTIAPLYPDRCNGENLKKKGPWQHVKVTFPRATRLLNRQFEPKYWDAILNKSKSIQPDLILANAAGFAPTASLLSKKINKPFVVIVRGYPVWQLMRNEPHTGRLEAVSNALLEADRVIAVSNCLAFELKKHLNISSFTIKNSPAIPANTRELLSFSERNIDILFAGTFTGRKRPEKIISLSKKISLHNVNIVFLGQGPTLFNFRESVNNNGNNKINILGFTRRSLVLEYMKKSKLMFLPSLNEGDPRVLLEAAAFGTPGIIPDLHWSKEIEGGVIKFSTMIELANKIKRVLTDQVFWNKLSKDAYSRVFQRSYNDVICEYKDVLGNLF